MDFTDEYQLDSNESDADEEISFSSGADESESEQENTLTFNQKDIIFGEQNNFLATIQNNNFISSQTRQKINETTNANSNSSLIEVIDSIFQQKFT